MASSKFNSRGKVQPPPPVCHHPKPFPDTGLPSWCPGTIDRPSLEWMAGFRTDDPESPDWHYYRGIIPWVQVQDAWLADHFPAPYFLNYVYCSYICASDRWGLILTGGNATTGRMNALEITNEKRPSSGKYFDVPLTHRIGSGGNVTGEWIYTHSELRG